MIFYSVERVFRKVEIKDEDIIKEMTDEEKEDFRALPDNEAKLDFLDELGWELAWASEDWIDTDCDCDDNWIEEDFDINLMEEI